MTSKTKIASIITFILLIAIAAAEVPPAPVNIVPLLITNESVNYTWAAGSGNTTNGYNVSVNGTWVNGTNLYSNMTIVQHRWANISVWAYNATGSGNLSTSNLNRTIQASTVCSLAWAKAVNLTIYTSNQRTCSNTSGSAGNMSVTYMDYSPSDFYNINLTTDTNTSKIMNESASNWTVRMKVNITNLDASSNYSIVVYTDSSGNVSQNWTQKSNAAGILLYNTSGFNASRHTRITKITVTSGGTYAYVVGFGTLIAAGVYYFLRKWRTKVG